MESPERSIRVHIVGGPGSGKTTLARSLGDVTGVPVVELDAVGYVGGAGARRPLATRLADIEKIAGRPAWITEGIFLGWTDALFEAADVIVWLDLPMRIALWRIVSRHIRASLAGTNRHQGLRALLLFLRNARRYYRGEPIASAQDDDAAVTRSATARALARCDHKVVRLQDRADVDAWVSRQHRRTSSIETQ